VWALDYGWSNPFVCLDVMIDSDDNFYVWREYMQSEIATHEHAKILMERVQPSNYHVDWGAGDPRGPDAAQTLTDITGVQIYGEDVQTEDNGGPNEAWRLGVEEVRKMLKVQSNGLPKLIISDECEELIRQMDQLHAPEVKEGKNALEGQFKFDDHGPDALRYLVGQYFLNGAGSSLGDVYRPGHRTEAETFFQQYASIDRHGRF
jgi:phage terminase large subunit